MQFDRACHVMYTVKFSALQPKVFGRNSIFTEKIPLETGQQGSREKIHVAVKEGPRGLKIWLPR